MASIAEMNIRLAADSRQLIKELDKASRKMKRTASDLSRSANDMFTSISLPLIGIGVSAVKSAANFESLTNAMTSTMGSAELAAAEIELLRQAALEPGLDFEQAVRGSVRLQAVGISAEASRKALSAFGNALALAGGSADDLDGVALALGQIASKGKISQEEINQLAERVPQINMAIKQAFGTVDTKELQKMGIDTEDFIDGVVKQLEKLPKATGGLGNSITNFGASVRMTFAKLGDSINKTLDLEGTLNKLASTIEKVTDWFIGLDDGVKKLVVNLGLVVIAYNALIKVKAGYLTIAAKVLDEKKNLIKGLDAMKLQLAQTTTAFNALSVAQKAMLAIGIGAVIAGITLAFQHFNTVAQRSADTVGTLKKISESAKDSILREKIEVQQLIKTVNDETLSKKQRAEALKKLKGINEEYFGGLVLEEGQNDKLIKQGDAYVKMILKKAEAEALAAEITKKQMELNQMKLGEGRAELSWLEKGLVALTKGFSISSGVYTQTKLQAGAYMESKAAIEEEVKALEERLALLMKTQDTEVVDDEEKKKGGGGNDAEKEKAKILAELSKEYDNIAIRQQLYGESIDSNKERSKALKDAIDELLKAGISPQDESVKQLSERYQLLNYEVERLGNIDASKGLIKIREEIEETKKAMDILLKDGINPQDESFQRLVEKLNMLNEQLEKVPDNYQKITDIISENTDSTEEKFDTFQERIGSFFDNFLPDTMNNLNESWDVLKAQADQFGKVMGTAATAAGNSMMELAAQGETSFKKLGQAALKSAADVVRKYIMEGVAAVVSKSMAALGPLGIAVGGAAGAAAGALFNRLLKSLKVPAFAKGGLVYGPQLAMVGDNPGASTDPEVIAPLSKLKNMMGGSTNVTGTIRISGSDLLVALESAGRNRGRYGG